MNGVTISPVDARTASCRARSPTREPSARPWSAAGASRPRPSAVGSEGDGATPNAVTPTFADNELGDPRPPAARGAGAGPAQRDGQPRPTSPTPPATTRTSSRASCSRPRPRARPPPAAPCRTASPVANQLPGAFLRRQAASLADRRSSRRRGPRRPEPGGARGVLRRRNTAELTQLCLNVIVADTQADAQAVHDQIAAGASFADGGHRPPASTQTGDPDRGRAAVRLPGRSWQLGPATAAAVEALADGPAGRASHPGPGQGSTGATTTFYLVVQMRPHQLVPFATLRSSIRQVILAGARRRGRDDLDQAGGRGPGRPSTPATGPGAPGAASPSRRRRRRPSCSTRAANVPPPSRGWDYPA